VHHRRFFAPVVAAREKHQAMSVEDMTIQDQVIQDKVIEDKVIPAEAVRDAIEVSAAAV
jgi:hypothetical protein